VDFFLKKNVIVGIFAYNDAKNNDDIKTILDNDEEYSTDSIDDTDDIIKHQLDD